MKKPLNTGELRASVKQLLEDGNRAGARRLLAERALSAAPLHEYPWLREQLGRLAVKPTPYRLGALATYTIEPIRDVLGAMALAHGFDIDIYFGGYQQIEQELFLADSGLGRHEPQLIVLAWRLEDLAPALAHSPLDLPGGGAEELAGLSERIRSLVEACKRNFPQAELLVHSFLCPDPPALGLIDFEHERGQRRIIERLNASLREIAATAGAVHLLDSEALARRSGPAWFEPRHWFVARAPHGPAALVELAREYTGYVRAVAGKTKKVLALDLDNTLWGGVLGEDGLHGIALGNDYPGNAFVAFQHELRNLARRGVLLVVNSKNNIEEVRELFAKHPHMVLDWKDFAASRVNWRDKATNMRELAAELSLGLDSFVFLDDSPHELEIVATELPEVAVVQVPREPALLPGLLLQRGYFHSVIYSDEDRRRTALYRAQTGRAQLEQSSSDLESFYRSLGMRLSAFEVAAEQVARVAQLTQRTNQFNMTTRRYSQADIIRFMEDPAYTVLAYRLEDRFGDSGIIAVVIVEREEATWRLDTFLMSCRVIGRTVETAILALLAAQARSSAASFLVGDVIPTAKNAPAREVYGRHGFKRIEESSACSHWCLSLDCTSPAVPAWIEVVGPGREAERRAL